MGAIFALVVATLGAALVVATVGAAAFGQLGNDPPAEDPAKTIATLSQQLLARETETITLEARLHTCEATKEAVQHDLESEHLSARVQAAIVKLKAAEPGSDWTWDQRTLTIQRVPAAPPVPTKEPGK